MLEVKSSALLQQKIIPECPQGHLICIHIKKFRMSKKELDYYIEILLNDFHDCGAPHNHGRYISNGAVFMFDPTNFDSPEKAEDWICNPFYNGREIENYFYCEPMKE